jgi:hypothetical protein
MPSPGNGIGARRLGDSGAASPRPDTSDRDRGDDQVSENPEDSTPWQQRLLDNIWVLLALSIVVPGVLYLGWGMWELAELPTWGQ